MASKCEESGLDQASKSWARRVSRRGVLRAGAACAGAAALGPLRTILPPLALAAQASGKAQVKIFDVLKYGAVGDGKTLDSRGISARHR
jgi:hypothetical protein